VRSTLSAGKPIFELDVLSFGPAEVAHAFAENAKISLPNLVCFGKTHQYADTARVIALLRKCAKRPGRYGTPKKCDKLAALHWSSKCSRASYMVR
jgi:hypothetical protein